MRGTIGPGRHGGARLASGDSGSTSTVMWHRRILERVMIRAPEDVKVRYDWEGRGTGDVEPPLALGQSVPCEMKVGRPNCISQQQTLTATLSGGKRTMGMSQGGNFLTLLSLDIRFKLVELERCCHQ